MNQEKNINTQAAAEVMTIDEFHRQLVENTEAINEERMAYERKKIHLDALERNTRDGRRKATELYLTGMAEAKGVHALKNLELQNQRHKIFEAYRNSGGQILPKTPSRCIQKDGAVQSLRMEE